MSPEHPITPKTILDELASKLELKSDIVASKGKFGIAKILRQLAKDIRPEVLTYGPTKPNQVPSTK